MHNELAKAAGVGLVAGGLLLAAPAGMAFADSALSDAVSGVNGAVQNVVNQNNQGAQGITDINNSGLQSNTALNNSGLQSGVSSVNSAVQSAVPANHLGGDRTQRPGEVQRAGPVRQVEPRHCRTRDASGLSPGAFPRCERKHRYLWAIGGTFLVARTVRTPSRQ